LVNQQWRNTDLLLAIFVPLRINCRFTTRISSKKRRTLPECSLLDWSAHRRTNPNL